MIRQPEFVTPQVFEWAKGALAKKKPELDLSRARLETFCEGLCVQAMHVGPYDAEPETLARMQRFALDSGCREELENGGAITSCTWATRAAPRPSGCAPCCVTR